MTLVASQIAISIVGIAIKHNITDAINMLLNLTIVLLQEFL